MDIGPGQSKTARLRFLTAHPSWLPKLYSARPIVYPIPHLKPRLQFIVAGAGVSRLRVREIDPGWPMLSLSAPRGATKGKERLSTGCRLERTSSCAFRGDTTAGPLWY